MRDMVLFITLNQAFKSVNNFKTEAEKIRAFDFILQKANSMLKLVNTRLEAMESKTEKKLKREKDKIKLNEKISIEVEKNRNILISSEITKPLVEEFEKQYLILKELLKLTTKE